MKEYALIAFDLDDTLAPSKTRLPDAMAHALARLLERTHVCIISGGNLHQFNQQVLEVLKDFPVNYSHLHLMPTCGTRYLRFTDSQWKDVYRRDLPEDERKEAMRVLEEEAKSLGYWEEKVWGDIIEDRGSQITFSALGQQAPVDEKKKWDPDNLKKNALRIAVAKKLPHLEVRSGGSTSVDITQKGIDKAYGINELVKQTGICVNDMLFIGDRLDEGGNDYPVLRLGIDTHAVNNWEDTQQFIQTYCSYVEGKNHEKR
ncbi:MAG: HAD-IIB family hydrolase [Actinomycetaceae bacterium]|nr:HAD-IIB family hydrolase [Actinomycetaceae bacterium]